MASSGIVIEKKESVDILLVLTGFRIDQESLSEDGLEVPPRQEQRTQRRGEV